ncbi:STOREKEEPER protein-like [Phalaenopsis equestris]|uniref:STOREKEEPER protein-like n=1 Tax=Phalaenopsis equestris TaxID=78828 RepID=UPI0009E50D60|nr:STOREKEEPER protein-like [Phalaenopsis equestris]
MAKNTAKKRPPPPPPSFSSSSDEDSPSRSIFPVKKLSAGSGTAALRMHTEPSLEPTDGRKEEDDKSSESPKRSHGAARRVSRKTDHDPANDVKLEKPLAATKTLEKTGSIDEKRKEMVESSESEEKESTDEESSEDLGTAARPPNPPTQLRDSQTTNDGKQEVSNNSSSSESGSGDGEEDGKEFNSRAESKQLRPRSPPQPARNSVNPIADSPLKPPNSSKSVAGEENEDEGSESEEEESTADNESSDSQNMDDDKQAPDPFLDPVSKKPLVSSTQPVEKEPNSGKQSAASHARISKKKRKASVVGPGGQEKERFRRIWSYEDELALLQGILEYKEQYHAIPYAHVHAESLLKSVKDSLSISVSANQITDKVRRLKKRYKNTAARRILAKRSKFSDAHNAAVFDLSKMIWDSLKEESFFRENKVKLEKREESYNKKKRDSKHFAGEYPSLYWFLRSDHGNNALVLQNHIPVATIDMLEEKCKKLEMIDMQLNMQKIEFLSSAVKLIKDALAKC